MPQINVLSLDGGGVRGIITSRLLELFCALAGIPADKIYQYLDRKSTRLNSSHSQQSRMPSSA